MIWKFPLITTISAALTKPTVAPTSPTESPTNACSTSATLFLNDPEDYDGGELEIESSFGAHSIKLAAGDLILYPASSQHRVTQVTAGCRSCAVFWLQSMVRDSSQREMLFDLDQSVQALGSELGQAHEDVMRLSGLYHNLVRQWAEI
jgi:PKHD-type hydroxylase